MLRAVLFDMDGVLLKSEEAWAHVVAAAGVRSVGLGLDGDARIEGLSELLEHI